MVQDIDNPIVIPKEVKIMSVVDIKSVNDNKGSLHGILKNGQRSRRESTNGIIFQKLKSDFNEVIMKEKLGSKISEGEISIEENEGGLLRVSNLLYEYGLKERVHT